MMRRLLVLLAALLAAGVTAALGWWQLDRAAQKSALEAAQQARDALPALDRSQLAYTVEVAAAQQHRRVVLEGRWMAARTVYLDNRQMNGRTGFFVVTPLQLGDGDAVLVLRGWLPRHAQSREQMAPMDTPAGTVRVAGRIAAGLPRLYEFDAAASGPIRQNLDLAAYARETGLALRPLVVVQLGEPAAPADGLLRQWPAPASDVPKHHGYAAQWFALSALITVLYVWFQLLRPRHRRSR
jgi:surfeit locus 1 family protein